MQKVLTDWTLGGAVCPVRVQECDPSCKVTHGPDMPWTRGHRQWSVKCSSLLLIAIKWNHHFTAGWRRTAFGPFSELAIALTGIEQHTCSSGNIRRIHPAPRSPDGRSLSVTFNAKGPECSFAMSMLCWLIEAYSVAAFEMSWAGYPYETDRR